MPLTDSIEDVVARSNLVPTAGEFVPRYLQNRITNQDVAAGSSIEAALPPTNKGKSYKKYQDHRQQAQDKNFSKNKNNLKYNKNYGFNHVNKRDAGDKYKNKAGCQREYLIEQLTKGILECLVCCERVQRTDLTWSCNNCFHVLHLRCVRKWARSSRVTDGWRCPACQHVTRDVPYDYFCFCGKKQDPEWNRVDCPHSCGEVCSKVRNITCPHLCTLLCHPGPCPQCTVVVSKSCGCGKTSKSVMCDVNDNITCDNICYKLLNCQVHICQQTCHTGACSDCTQVFHQVCHCGKEERDVTCAQSSSQAKQFSCNQSCGKTLSCQNHTCQQLCHAGPCGECGLSPNVITKCSCGQTKLDQLENIQPRISCLDKIPTCDKQCNKTLTCGQPGNGHKCQSKCHEGSCSQCQLETSVKCRCGHIDKMIPCKDLVSRADDARCEKKCTKQRSCGKHRCNQYCCIDIDHECPLICNRQLTCSLHRCEETCHKGHCKPCYRASFEELYCECGSEVIYPPVRCGTRRPTCHRQCSRNHSCSHTPTHNCHSDVNCPPCTVLTQKLCYGRHELRKAVPCHQESFSCGLPCNKDLPCGRHRCNLPCHPNQCLKDGQVCTQGCSVERTYCGHGCGAACHDGNCPDTPCKETVRVTCECGHRFTSKTCHEHSREYQRLTAAKLAAKTTDEATIDITDVVAKLSFKTLECNEECRRIERNRRLAIGLQIRNPDLSSKLTPRYSDFMKQWAKKDSRFCQMVHDKLTDLVQLAKQSKQKSRSYSFESMNRDKRHFVHEYCEHFGCESVAYDQEPNRNVVATALREKSWLPSLSLLEVIQKETGQRRIPIPTNDKLLLPSVRTMDVLPIKTSSNVNQSTTQEHQIDYFDFT